MRSTLKKFRQFQSSSHSLIVLSNMIDNSSLIFNTEQLEKSIKINVESNILFYLLIYTKQLNEFILNDERFSKEIEKNLSNKFLNELIKLIEYYFEKYSLSSIILRCYIQLHVPSSQTGHNQNVNI